MPELPDIVAYLDALAPRILGLRLERVRVTSPFLLRTADPPLSAVEGKTVTGLRRLGKRIVWEMEDQIFLVFHLMIAGRFKWRKRGAKAPGKIGLATFDFPDGTLVFTEATKKHRASLHAAKLSPFQLTGRLTEDEIARLHGAARRTLLTWIDRLRAEMGFEFPEKVTAFRDGMAVHGRYRQPCPVCGSPVQRIRYAENEANYCATCQTEGRVLADRALSRLLKDDWPRSLEEWEERMGS